MYLLQSILNIFLVICSLFLICLVLIQRGKGGGLTGAFGGTGGSSAFGAKAGDVFTKVTMITAGIWIGMAMLLVILTNYTVKQSAYDVGDETTGSEVPIPGGLDPGASDEDLFPPVQGASAGSDLVPETAPAAPSAPTSTSGSASSPALSPAGTPPPDASNPGPATAPPPG